MQTPAIRMVGHDRDGFLCDSLGRRHPTRFNSLMALRAVPGLAEQFKTHVPGDFYFQSGTDEVVIACPCGAEPVATAGRISECECERFYLLAGGEVRVANSPIDA